MTCPNERRENLRFSTHLRESLRVSNFVFRSALVADNLQKIGYTNVESMDGGWKG